MSFTHMGAVAGMASPDSSSSQMYRRGVLIHCPPEYSVDIVPPVKEGSSWHYGLRVKPLASLGSPIDGPGDKARRIKGYEIHRKWEDCLDLQRLLEKEYAAVAKARKGGKKIYGGRPERAASFDSLPTGPDPKTIPTDIHAFIPRLAAKSSLFRGASGSALVQQRSEEFNEFISALFAPGVPILVDEVRQTPSVREWFGFWRRDRDSMRRRDGDRASIAPSTRRLSIVSDAPPLPPNSTSPFTSSPLAQTSYESSPISSTQEEPRQSCDTTYGDLASALDTFPMPPTPLDGPVALEPSPKAASQPMPNTGFVPIVQRRLGLVRNDAARNAAFRNAQFFSHPPTSPLPPLPKSVPASDCEYESDRARRPDGRPRRATSPTMSSASHLSQPTRSASPRSSRTSDWSMSAMAQALGLSIDEPEPISPAPAPTPADEQSEIEYARKASLSSLSSTSSKRPPPIPPRSSLRRSQSSGAHIQKQEHPIPTVVYDEHEPEFEITHSVINSYFEDNRASMLSSALSSNSGSSVRRSMTPSIASAYSTTSSVGSAGVPSTPLTAIPAHEIVLKAACPVGDSIVVARIPRALPLEAVRSVLATKFRQAAGVQLDVLEHGFVLGYLSAPRPTRPGTGGRPVTPARSSARPPAGRTRSSSLSSMAACADPTHLTLIVTQRDWENAVAKHGEKMTVRVLLAGSD